MLPIQNATESHNDYPLRKYAFFFSHFYQFLSALASRMNLFKTTKRFDRKFKDSYKFYYSYRLAKP